MPAERPETYISVDIETAGPNPAEYSMLSIGACRVVLMAPDAGPQRCADAETVLIGSMAEPPTVELAARAAAELVASRLGDDHDEAIATGIVARRALLAAAERSPGVAR